MNYQRRRRRLRYHLVRHWQGTSVSALPPASSQSDLSNGHRAFLSRKYSGWNVNCSSDEAEKAWSFISGPHTLHASVHQHSNNFIY